MQSSSWLTMWLTRWYVFVRASMQSPSRGSEGKSWLPARYAGFCNDLLLQRSGNWTWLDCCWCCLSHLLWAFPRYVVVGTRADQRSRFIDAFSILHVAESTSIRLCAAHFLFPACMFFWWISWWWWLHWNSQRTANLKIMVFGTYLKFCFFFEQYDMNKKVIEKNAIRIVVVCEDLASCVKIK